MEAKQKIILTGDRPTGKLHIGHYVGSLRRRVELQNSGEYDKIYIFEADAQALTDNIDNPEKVRQNVIEVALDYLSAGLDPARSTLFIQSQIPELCELSFYFMDLVSVSRLQRNPTVKTEVKMRGFSGDSIPVGFFTYPISQAADITLFKATTVPVGEDQEPMIEQCREIVRRFNNIYGPTLVEPEILLPTNAACLRLPGTDGKAKMSKSLGNYVGVNEPADVMYHKIYNLADSIVENWFELLTDVPLAEIKQMMADVASGKLNPNVAKDRLAKNIVAQYYGAEAAEAAAVKEKEIHSGNAIPSDAKECRLDAGEYKILDLLVQVKAFSSKGEARRMVQNGGVKLAGEKVSDPMMEVKVSGSDQLLVQVGKRNFFKVNF